MHSILIVEHDKALRSLLSFMITSAGYESAEAPDAISAIDLATRIEPHLAVLDMQLPDMNGQKLLRYWRADDATQNLPVLMLTDSQGPQERTACLKAGADDCLSKPFDRAELIARIEAVLRRCVRLRNDSEQAGIKQANGLQLDLRSLRVLAGDRPVHLGPIEFKLLNVFMSHMDRALSRSQIVDKVWRVNAYVDERTVDVHVRRLRRALRATGHDKMIQTVRGVGYRFASDPRGRHAN